MSCARVVDEVRPNPSWVHRVAAPPPRPPAAGPRQATLTTSDGAQTVALGDEVVTMGRGTDQRLRIPDSRASRAHAVVRPRAKGGWEVKDVGSANGTLLNGHTIPEGRVAPLRDGDRIGIGPVTITYTEGDGGPPAGRLPPAGPDATSPPPCTVAIWGEGRRVTGIPKYAAGVGVNDR